MYSENVFIKKMQQQAVVYNNLIAGLEIIKDTVPKWDGKIYNIKFTTLLNDATLEIGVRSSIREGNNRNGGLIKIWCDQNLRSFRVGEFSCAYVDDSDISLYISLKEKRVDAKATLSEIGSYIDSLNERLATCTDAYTKLSGYLEEIKKLEMHTASVIEKIPYQVRYAFMKQS